MESSPAGGVAGGGDHRDATLRRRSAPMWRSETDTFGFDGVSAADDRTPRRRADGGSSVARRKERRFQSWLPVVGVNVPVVVVVATLVLALVTSKCDR